MALRLLQTLPHRPVPLCSGSWNSERKLDLQHFPHPARHRSHQQNPPELLGHSWNRNGLREKPDLLISIIPKAALQSAASNPDRNHRQVRTARASPLARQSRVQPHQDLHPPTQPWWGLPGSRTTEPEGIVPTFSVRPTCPAFSVRPTCQKRIQNPQGEQRRVETGPNTAPTSRATEGHLPPARNVLSLASPGLALSSLVLEARHVGTECNKPYIGTRTAGCLQVPPSDLCDHFCQKSVESSKRRTFRKSDLQQYFFLLCISLPKG